MDTISRDRRSFNMARIKSTDTGPEMFVRRLLHRLGYRYRRHQRELPGCPDIVFARRRKLVFVHCCFWHGHDCDRGGKPKSHQNYWGPKLERNKQRDAITVRNLATMGWSVLIIWECETEDKRGLTRQIVTFLEN